MDVERVAIEDMFPDWRPIETAPKDGTEILVYGFCQFSVAKRGERQWLVYTDEGWFGPDGTPTHWMPLPAPPTV